MSTKTDVVWSTKFTTHTLDLDGSSLRPLAPTKTASSQALPWSGVGSCPACWGLWHLRESNANDSKS